MSARSRVGGPCRIPRSSAAALLAVALIAGCAGAPIAGGPGPDTRAVAVQGLHLSAAGYMLDLRYRVTDVERARALFSSKAHPLLVDERSGLKLAVPDTPKLGQLRSTGARHVAPGRTYSMLFANPARYVERGAKLTLVIGDERIEGLTVE